MRHHKGLVYLAGKMRGLPEFGFPLFDKGKRILEQHGYEVVSPADMDRLIGFDPRGLHGTDEELAQLKFSTADALRRDFQEILNCTHFALLSNWRDSGGAKVEKMVAGAIDLIMLDVDLDAGTVAPHKEGSILEEAGRLVYGDRQEAYGHPRDDFARSAQMMSAILGAGVRADQVPLLMIAVKISRLCERYKRDSVVDLAGYAATLERVMED